MKRIRINLSVLCFVLAALMLTAGCGHPWRIAGNPNPETPDPLLDAGTPSPEPASGEPSDEPADSPDDGGNTESPSPTCTPDAEPTPTESSGAAETIVGWDFESETAVASTANAANTGATVTRDSTVTFSYSSGNGSSKALSSTGWADASADSPKYYAATVNAAGYTGITVSAAFRASNTGPKNIILQYSTNGTDFSDAGSVALSGTSWGTIANAELPESCNGAETLYLRFAVLDTVSANGGTIAGTGTLRVDDIIVTGMDSGEPTGNQTVDPTDAIPTESQNISQTPTPAPVLTSTPAPTPKPTNTPAPTPTPKPTNTPVPTATPVPSNYFTTVAINGDHATYDNSMFADAQLTMINIWATSCGPCIQELPHIQELAAAYESRGVRIVTVLGDSEQSGMINYALNIINGLGFNLPVLRNTASFSAQFPAGAYPTTYFVDRGGNIVRTVTTSNSYSEWCAILDELLR